MKKYTKFEYTKIDGIIIILFNEEKNNEYLYILDYYDYYFRLYPKNNKNKRIVDNRSIIKFDQDQGFDTYTDVLDYIEQYF